MFLCCTVKTALVYLFSLVYTDTVNINVKTLNINKLQYRNHKIQSLLGCMCESFRVYTKKRKQCYHRNGMKKKMRNSFHKQTSL